MSSLRLAYKDELFLFCLLVKEEQINEYLPKNLQILATKIYEEKYDFGPEIMKDISPFPQKPYNLRNDPKIQRRRNRSVYFGT